MKKVKSTLVVASLLFIVALAAVGCAQTGSDTMETSATGTGTKSLSGDTMDSSMDKAMDTMDAEKMDGSMEKDMQNGMK